MDSGNIDVNILAKVIDQGLVETGRLVQLEIKITNRPGCLGRLLSTISSTSDNVLEIYHERAFE